ncbi:MAG: hypothetical protein LC775_17135, partial [Acidobacteria bacterium]|nr:hypothetical protein [Acidobacteriota bacterium]
MPDRSDPFNKAMLEEQLRSNRITRKELLRRAFAGAVVLGTSGVLGACGGDEDGSGAPQSQGGSQKQKRGGIIRLG